jgi:hypothetical protein
MLVEVLVGFVVVVERMSCRIAWGVGEVEEQADATAAKASSGSARTQRCDRRLSTGS